MTAGRAIVVLTNESETASAVASAMKDAESVTIDEPCRTFGELVTKLDRTPAAVLVVDIDPNPEQMLRELDPVIGRFPNVRCVVVCDSLRNDLIVQAMQVGARHFMAKDALATDLRGAIERIAPNGTINARAKGTLVTVLSAGGGAGATTLAVNLANELRVAAESESLIVDMDCCYGSSCSHLGVEGMYGLTEVLCENRSIDAELIRSTVVNHPDGPGVLMNPATVDPSEPATLDFTNLSRMLQACREAYAHVVIDAPRVPIDAAAEMARASLATLLVFQCSVKDLRVAKSILTALMQRGIAADSILPVASRYRKRYGMISISDAERALGERRIGTISNDFVSAQKAQNYGQLLAECAARSSLRRDIRSLASSIIEAQRSRTIVKDW